MAGRKNGAARRDRLADQITPQQYKRAWELVSTYHTTQQVLGATGLTRPQLAWLMKVGSEAKGMPAFQKRLAEEVAIIRARAKEAAAAVGVSAVDALKASIETQKLAQRAANAIIYVHLRTRVAPAMARVEAGEATEETLSEMAMPDHVQRTLKALKPYTDFTEVAATFRGVFDSPHQAGNPLNGLPKGVKLNLSGDFSEEGVLPASVALVEELDKASVGHDLLDDMMPEYRGWTIEEIDHYLETGERPARDYGEDADVVDTSAEPADGTVAP